MKLLQLFLFGLILVSLVSAVSQTSSAIILAGQMKNMTLFLDKGDYVSGSFNVTGGNEDIDFSIRDPTGKEILSSVRVQKGGTFTLTPDQSGAYTIVFDNSFSSNADKGIVLSYSATYISTAPEKNPGICDWMVFVLGSLLFLTFVLRNE